MGTSKKYGVIIFGVCLLALSLTTFSAQAQDKIDYTTPKEYRIAGISVSGSEMFDPDALILASGLSVGSSVTIPGDRISSAIDRLWKQGLFEDVKITIAQISGQQIYLNIHLEERAKISSIVINGVKRLDAKNLKEDIGLKEDEVITDNRIAKIKEKAEKYYKDKGYLFATVDVVKQVDTSRHNSVKLTLNVDRHHKDKINQIIITGNEYTYASDSLEKDHNLKQTFRHLLGVSDKAFSDSYIRRKLKNTKEKNIFRFYKRSKYVEDDFQEDLKSLIAAYNKQGFRDARIVRDTFYYYDDKLINVEVDIFEGRPYYFGDITFAGNTKYSDEILSAILNIQKGEVFNEEKLSMNLNFNPKGGDINSLYYDDGYLTFQASPVETNVYNDTVDLEIRIHEGKQARINKVSIKGNNRTNDYIIIRESHTYPGKLFSRTDLISSMNELRQLRYFNDQTINPDVRPNMENGTADIEFQVEEVGSDQIELSGGWGGGMVVGTIGIVFNNFSIQNIFKKDRWRPLPTGDGQQLSLRAQSSGNTYYSISTSFTEPWLGGKKPRSLSVSFYHSVQNPSGLPKGNPNRQSMRIEGASVGLGQRLKYPDPFFTLYQSISYQHYTMHNYTTDFLFPNGEANNLAYTITLSRQSLDAAVFPKNGSDISLSLQLTPPYSMFNGLDYSTATPQERYRWIEYYKWSFKAGWFFNPVANLVLNARFRLGVLNYYNSEVGYPPFERYYMGGDGLTGFALDGRELIGLRGYKNNSLSPSYGATSFDKVTFELRYPLSLNPAATIYALVFAEGGNSWVGTDDINPFQMYKSAGVGVRLFLAAMGMFGLDWGYGFDAPPGRTKPNGSEFHFSINQSLDW